MDEQTILNLSVGLKRAHDALAEALCEDDLFDESGVEIIRLIARRLVSRDLGREPTPEEQEAILGRIEANLKGGDP